MTIRKSGGYALGKPSTHFAFSAAFIAMLSVVGCHALQGVEFTEKEFWKGLVRSVDSDQICSFSLPSKGSSVIKTYTISPLASKAPVHDMTIKKRGASDQESQSEATLLSKENEIYKNYSEMMLSGENKYNKTKDILHWFENASPHLIERIYHFCPIAPAAKEVEYGLYQSIAKNNLLRIVKKDFETMTESPMLEWNKENLKRALGYIFCAMQARDEDFLRDLIEKFGQNQRVFTAYEILMLLHGKPFQTNQQPQHAFNDQNVQGQQASNIAKNKVLTDWWVMVDSIIKRCISTEIRDNPSICLPKTKMDWSVLGDQTIHQSPYTTLMVHVLKWPESDQMTPMEKRIVYDHLVRIPDSPLHCMLSQRKKNPTKYKK